MDEHEILDILSGRTRGLGVTFLRSLLLLASWPYSAGVRLRRRIYRCGLLPSRRAGVPVISVGNLTTGGVGKTPMVAWVVRQLRQAGLAPAILTRGYKAIDGRSDEAALLEELTRCPAVVDADRLRGAAAAIAGGADVLVLDDGFQHRRLRRDLDIVLIDATNPFGYGHCLPRGLLREPPAALKDADAIVLTHSDAVGADAVARLRGRLARAAPSATLHAAVHKPLRVLSPDEALPLDALAGRKICAFCGIGNPESFFRLLGELNARIVHRRALEDHVNYTPKLIQAFRDDIQDCQADVLVTTQKDAIKLTGADLGKPVWQLVVEMQLTDGADELAAKVRGAAMGE